MALGGSGGGGGGGGGSASAVRAGRAFVEVGGKDAGLSRVLNRAAARVKSFGRSVAGVGLRMGGFGAAITGGFGALAGSVLSGTQEVSRLAQKLGMSVEELSRFAYVADREAGQSLEDLAGHAENWAERVTDAANGAGEAAETFNKLGLSAANLKNMSFAEQMRELSRAMVPVTNQMERLGYLSKLGSDQFQNMDPFLKLGPDEIQRRMARAEAIGAVVSAEDAANAKAYGQAWTDIKAAVGGVARAIVSAVLPSREVLKGMSEAAIDVVVAVRGWIGENRGLITTVSAVVVGVTAAGAALAGFGGFVMLAGAGLSGLVAVAAAVKVAVVGAFTALLSPVGLAVAAIGGIGYVLATQTEAGRTATAELGQLFTDLGTTATEAWGGVVDAVKSGDLALAGRIAVAGLTVAWKLGLLKLTEAWAWAKGVIVDGWQGMISSLSLTFNDWTSWVRKQWADVTATLDFGQDIGPAKAEAERKKQEIEREREATERTIRADAAREQAARDKFRREQVEAAKSELEAARRELAQLVQQARTQANRPAAGGSPRTYVPGAPDLPFQRVIGAFRAPDWRQLFGGTDVPKKQLEVQKEILKEGQKQNDFLGDIFQKIEQFRGMRFS